MERHIISPTAHEHGRGENIPSSMLGPTLPSKRSSSSQGITSAQTTCNSPRLRSADRSSDEDVPPQQMPQNQLRSLPHAIITTPGVQPSLPPSQGASSPFISEDNLTSTPTRTPASPSGHNHVPRRENLTKTQHLAFRSCTFVLFRILLFPKTAFVKGLSFGRGLLDCLRLTRTRRSSHFHRQRRHHFRSYQRSSSTQGRRYEHPGNTHSGNSQQAGDPSRPPILHRRRHSNSRSRPRHGSYSGSAAPSQSLVAQDNLNGCVWGFLNGYNAQVGLICLCLIGESFAQSVMCPFLYYMVRDFHVGKDIWIGYYAGLLWTGFWSANLVTTMLWGHLSDKYGRKVVMIFGLFMTSLSTLCLGLSTCYHDAMMALVVQGACTSLIPVSKCSIGEIANRQQRLYDMHIISSQRRPRQRRSHTEGPSVVEDMDLRDISEPVLNEKSLGGLPGETKAGCEDDGSCSDPECWGSEIDSEATVTDAMEPLPKIDFASKGYSALVIALAIGAALGPLAGGNLTHRQVLGFESYPYFAPCLLASSVGLVLTGIVAFGLNESHPKWAKPAEVERVIEREAHESEHRSFTPIRRGRSGYEMARDLRELSTITTIPKSTLLLAQDITEMPATLCVDVARGSAESQACGLRSAIQEIQLAPSACTCTITSDSATMFSEGDESFTLSPATELCLVLTIYTLLVLTSILGSEFVMLYTQSSSIRGGLQYSAKVFGQVLTMRGIIKLVFTLFGYPWMVARMGLLKCLRLGIFIIGFTSVFGLGLLVPWNVYKEDTSTSEQMHDMKHTGTGFGPGLENEDGRSAGVGTILLCLSLISMGDVLGYISVLVLFGKSAERLKGVCIKNGATMTGDNALDQAQSSTARGGSGVLWSVAQASANVMRLAAPVLAGLLWSLTNKQSDVQSASTIRFHYAPLEPGANSALVSNSQLLSQSAFKVPGQTDENNAVKSVLGRWPSLTFAMDILQGSTNVFYLVGAICVLNFITCQALVASKRLWSYTTVPMRQCPLHISYSYA